MSHINELTNEDDFGGVFSAEIDEDFDQNFRCGVAQVHDDYFHDPPPDEKKKNPCLRCLGDLWATRNRKMVQDKETIMRTTVRELFIYLGFIIVLLTIALLPTAYLQTYFFTDVVQQFTVPLNSSGKDAFSKITNREAMWDYIQNGFLMALYSDTSENRLVGRGRLRQLKVNKVDCGLPIKVPKALDVCYPTFSSFYESRTDMKPAANATILLTQEAWKWRSTKESGSDSTLGTIATYPGSGYYLDLALTRNDTAEMLDELLRGHWTDESTRAVILEFTLYNANLNYFTVGRVLFETPYTGGVIASAEIRPYYLTRQYSASEYLIFVCELIALFFVFYYIIKECISIYKLGLAYFRHFWHLVDFMVISLSIACVILNIYNRAMLYSLLKRGIMPNGVYPEFAHIGNMTLLYNRLLALLVFFALIQIFKFVSFSETMGQLTATINYALYDMIGFFVMFGIVFAAFVQAGTLMFGATSQQFQSFDLTAFALYRIILGDFDMDAIKAAHKFLGPLYFIIYIFFVFFVLLNMFLAIIGEAYAKVKEDMAKRKNDFKFIGYLRYNTKEFFARFNKNHRMPLDKVLQSAGVGDQLELTFCNWRRAMKAAGYTEMEAQFLFHKYDRDHDQMLDYAERRRMREDMTIGMAFQPMDSDDECQKGDEEKSSKTGTNTDFFAEREDCEELVERIADVEESVNAIVKQICTILGKMERSERQRRENERGLMKSIL